MILGCAATSTRRSAPDSRHPVQWTWPGSICGPLIADIMHTLLRSVTAPCACKSRPPVLASLLLVVTAACSRGRDTVGPCYIGYDEPLFTVASAQDVVTGAAIERVVLRDFVLDRPPGPRPGMSYLTEHLGLQPRNVEISGSELLCQVVCAFGAGQGGYTFTFGAPGYRDTTVTVNDARYTKGRGNCPAFLSGGMVLNLRLRSE